MTNKILDVKYISQGNDSCCFVYAVANCLIYLNQQVADLEQAKDIACCRTGSTIHYNKVIEYFKAPLVKTRNPNNVYKNGGILTINHPIFNGHALFLFPERHNLTLVNSWLGPNVCKGISINEINQFIYKNRHKDDALGNHYYIKR